ncbi:MAG: metallophosphoesterase [Alkalibacterium sp.]|uniref:metallophosphoesterase n=1 Tax=Alkalibacterium sp. TaxID=1872447 RepID=UPI0026490542|nr:metallophosphoesterase [Alkalibacterium sp.]MDN6293887.1 metallophosphoesterase [Alkalibacterium sp.]MDN6296176.1 metallophosphoesterase [Alkalibacterium sp.]MDN6327458.1 metallophosphoesterase [Alkalibacterium sp.]MDN6397959.1 metallophosphoesterase [Alkalibacterium sp.]
MDKMRIGTVSDLHIDRNKWIFDEGETTLSILVTMLKEKAVDVLLIAGDISNHYLESHVFIEELMNESGIVVKFVPGNHDYWAKDHEVTDSHKINQFFNKQEYSLIGKPYELNRDWVVVGTPGWYDYGYGNHEKYTEAQFEKKKYGFASWNDLHFVDWHQKDREVSKEMLDQLYKDLESVKDKNIILMTHVATHEAFVVPLPHRIYDFANAFLGAKSYESVYKDFESIKYSIMGHVHFRKVISEEDRTFISPCLGSSKHWRDKRLRNQLERSIVTFDI